MYPKFTPENCISNELLRTDRQRDSINKKYNEIKNIKTIIVFDTGIIYNIMLINNNVKQRCT